MRLVILMGLAVVVFGACNPDKTKRVSAEGSKFSTSDASELFFKNVRQLYYDKTTMEEAKLDVYRIKDRNKAEDQPVLSLSIVINWRYDEAYLLTEPNHYLQELTPLKILWQDTITRQQGYYNFHAGSKEDHFKFATQIYQSIQNEHQFYLIKDDEKVDFLRDKRSREAFRKTMFDYFRLVDLL